MTVRQNLHTHTIYSDGKNSVKEMAEEAEKIGFDSLGFSDHAYTGFPFDECGIQKDRIDEYFNEIRSIDSPIELYASFEYESRDIFSDNPKIDERCDYSIGSVHYCYKEGRAYPVDLSKESFIDSIDAFGGENNYINAYFEEVVRFADVSSYDIIGHFDLLTKFSVINENSPEYIDRALSALDAVIERDKIFEINTGAISRGYRRFPYPSFFLIRRLIEKNAHLIITSDAHRREHIDSFFDETEEILKSMGLKESVKFTPRGFTTVKIGGIE